MFTASAILLIIAVTLRAVFWYRQGPAFDVLVTLLTSYLLLMAGSTLFGRVKSHNRLQQAWQAIYLVVQASLVARILSLPPLNDFCALLYVPLSIQAVQYFRRRTGFFWILAFTSIMALILVRGGDKFPGGLVMALLFGGVCSLAGSYSHLIQAAEETRRKNHDMLIKLQAAHLQLQKYAHQRQELAAEKERHRLANELHDSVTQSIFSMNLTTQTARLLLARNASGVEGLLVQLQTLAQSVMSEIQMVATQLRPLPEAPADLVDNVKRLIANKHSRTGIDVQLETNGVETLPAAAVDALSHIVQEALNNVTKHSGVNQAIIRINLAKEPLSIEIEDNGAGFDPPTVHGLPGHFGLAAMAEQAREIGWNLSINSRVGGGTLVRIEKETTANA